MNRKSASPSPEKKDKAHKQRFSSVSPNLRLSRSNNITSIPQKYRLLPGVSNMNNLILKDITRTENKIRQNWQKRASKLIPIFSSGVAGNSSHRSKFHESPSLDRIVDPDVYKSNSKDPNNQYSQKTNNPTYQNSHLPNAYDVKPSGNTKNYNNLLNNSPVLKDPSTNWNLSNYYTLNQHRTVSSEIPKSNKTKTYIEGDSNKLGQPEESVFKGNPLFLHPVHSNKDINGKKSISSVRDLKYDHRNLNHQIMKFPKTKIRTASFDPITGLERKHNMPNVNLRSLDIAGDRFFSYDFSKLFYLQSKVRSHFSSSTNR